LIAVLGGFGAALAFGCSVLAYARATRTVDGGMVLGWVMLIGLLLVAPAVLLFGLPVNLTPVDVVWLLLVGIGNTGGLLLEFRALRLTKVGIVATIASTEGAIAAVFSVIAGEPLSLALALALAVVVVGVVLTTIVPGELEALERSSTSTRLAVAFAAGAATLFGLGLFATGRVSAAIPVVWILVPARLIGTLGFALPLAVRGRLAIRGPAVPPIIVAGVAEVVGFGSFAIGARDSVAVSAVLVSQFATVALLLGWLLFRERLSRIQLAGVGTVIIGVAAVVLAQA
jgi:drug/metabolite transporter (DMT)-like permease